MTDNFFSWVISEKGKPVKIGSIDLITGKIEGNDDAKKVIERFTSSFGRPE